jgi:hypothetical protein
LEVKKRVAFKSDNTQTIKKRKITKNNFLVTLKNGKKK